MRRSRPLDGIVLHQDSNSNLTPQKSDAAMRSLKKNFYGAALACLLPDTGERNVDSLLNQQILPVLSQMILQLLVNNPVTGYMSIDVNGNGELSVES
ncbi:MAG TPA: hypothetical protein DEO73_00645 [Pantoea sp.]|nr:hypothetical protein [Pantoea sp.]